MSRARYLQALRCQCPDVIPHQVSLLHPEFISDAGGVDYYDRPLTASLYFHERFDIDNGGPIHVEDAPIPRPEYGKTEDGGERSGEALGTVWHNKAPFTEPEELWDFDPDPWGKDADKAIEPAHAVKNFRWVFEPDSWPARRAQEESDWARVEKAFPGKFTDARAFYCTSFMWAICIFGWEVFLTALGLDPERTGETIQRISEITERMYEYFATCDGAEFVAPHDDLCAGTGPVTSPEWYRKYIYPEYERIFAPVRSAGKPIILISDGDIRELAPDVSRLVDGFNFEYSTPAEFMFEKFGRDKCLIGGVDVRIVAFGTVEDIESEVRRASILGRDCPGFVIGCSSSIAADVPLENVYAYFDAIERWRHRR